MGIFIILTLILIILIYCNCDENFAPRGKKFFSAILFAIFPCGIFTIFFAILISTCFIGFCIPKQESSYSFEINSLKDNVASEGHFSMHSGYIDGELEYFYCITTDKGDKVEHLEASDCYLVYNNNVHPNIKVVQSYYPLNRFEKFMFFDLGFNKKYIDYYVITLPEDSVIYDEYEVDLE